jgi:hypothetical protein
MVKVKIQVSAFISSETLEQVGKLDVEAYNREIEQLFLNNVVEFPVIPKPGDHVVLGDFLASFPVSETTDFYSKRTPDKVYTVKTVIIRKDYLLITCD